MPTKLLSDESLDVMEDDDPIVHWDDVIRLADEDDLLYNNDVNEDVDED